jgi:hypothetical protein
MTLLRNLQAVVIAGLIGALVAKAGAQPSNERVLVIDVSKGRGSEARLVKGLSEHLERSGMLLTEGALSAQDRACDGPECIEELAKREGAGLVLTAKIQENAASSFFITMALFDALRRAPLQETAVCDQCNQELLIVKLNDVADKLIRQCREARLVPTHTTQSPNVPLVPSVTDHPGIGNNSGNPHQVNQGFFAGLSPKRKIIAGVLGGLAGVALITGIALTATDGRDTTGCVMKALNHVCVMDNVGGYATAYALTGALAVGVGFALFWPENPSKPVSSEVR